MRVTVACEVHLKVREIKKKLQFLLQAMIVKVVGASRHFGAGSVTLDV